MNLNVRQVNTASTVRNRDFGTPKNTASFSPLNNNIQNSHSDISFGGLGTFLQGFGEKFTKSCSTFNDYNSRTAKLNILFGGEYEKMEKELERAWGTEVFRNRIRHNDGGSVTFVEEGILPKFFKSAIYPVKDLWLDLATWALEGMSNLDNMPRVSGFARRKLSSGLLKRRLDAKRYEEIFAIMQGALTDISRDERASEHAQRTARKIIRAGSARPEIKKVDNVELVLENMVHSTGSVKGNYKTADERTLNRLCTGMVSATMAGTDFYNISRMQTDDDTLARQSQQKRFKQESSRILMSAAMTFLTLGALSKFANANKYVALATISGTTLVSEILSRMMSGMPLHPLTPEEAKAFSRGQHNKKTGGAAQSVQKESNATQNTLSVTLEDFMSTKGDVCAKYQKQQGFKGDKSAKAQNNDNKEENESPLTLKNALAAIKVLFVSGMAIGFVRSRCPNLNDFLKSVGKGMDNAIKMLTTKEFCVPYEEFKKIVDTIGDDYGLKEYAKSYYKALEDVEKHPKIIKNIDGKNVEYVKLGNVDKKIIAPVVKAITYPFNFVWGAMKFPFKMVKLIFNKEAPKNSVVAESKDMIGLYNIFNKAQSQVESGKMTQDEFAEFIKRKTIIGIEDKTGKSTYKNSSLAAISRPIVTLIASYFFVNDYRNEVLITSGGKDIEGANSVAKERIMHKVSNFFFNAMLMNLFNSVFEKAYHASLIGAGAVAAATEITNENLIRKSIGVPTKKMTKAEIEEHDRQNLERDDFWGKYFRFMSRLTGKKTISQKVKDEEKKKAAKALETQPEKEELSARATQK